LAIRQGFFYGLISEMINYFANILFIVKYFYICKQSNNKSFAEAEKQNRVGSTLKPNYYYEKS